MNKKLIIASVVVIGLTIFYFKVVKKKSVRTSVQNIQPITLNTDVKDRPISVNNQQFRQTAPSRQSTIANAKAIPSIGQVKMQISANNSPINQFYKGNNQPTSNSTNATNYCPPEYVWNTTMQSCQKIF